MPDQESGLTLVSFVLRQGGMAVFGVETLSAALVVARVVEIGDEGAVSAVRTLHADERLAVAGR